MITMIQMITSKPSSLKKPNPLTSDPPFILPRSSHHSIPPMVPFPIGICGSTPVGLDACLPSYRFCVLAYIFCIVTILFHSY